MKESFESGSYIFTESFTMGVANSLGFDPLAPILENKVSDIQVKDINAVYPLIRAIHSERLTKNFTYYPRESLIGTNNKVSPTGYASFVLPYGKPIIREHRSQDSFMGEADEPIGRVVFAGYKQRGKEDTCTPHPTKGYPGFVEGEGYINCVAAISDKDAIPKVLGSAYHTVSIGSKVDKVIESISGIDIAKARREGKELPPYSRGQLYDGALSYWRMGPVTNIETSFVNVPSDEYAKVTDPDIGVTGLKLLLGEKKVGSKEFCFYDARNGELVTELSQICDMYEVDPSFALVDSFSCGREYWWKPIGKTTHTESANLSVFAESFIDTFLKAQASKANEAKIIDTIDEVLNK